MAAGPLDATEDRDADSATGSDGEADAGIDTSSAEADFTGPVVFDDEAVAALDPSRLPAGPSPCREPRLVRVDWAYDGDTIRVEGLDGSASERVRIVGVDTPEIAHNDDEVADCYADTAHDFSIELRGHLVWLTFDGRCVDAYDRTLAYVHTGLGEAAFWERQLLRRGLGRVLIIGSNRAFAGEFSADEATARTNEAGLWSACPE